MSNVHTLFLLTNLAVQLCWLPFPKDKLFKIENRLWACVGGVCSDWPLLFTFSSHQVVSYHLFRFLLGFSLNFLCEVYVWGCCFSLHQWTFTLLTSFNLDMTCIFQCGKKQIDFCSLLPSPGCMKYRGINCLKRLERSLNYNKEPCRLRIKDFFFLKMHGFDI